MTKTNYTKINVRTGEVTQGYAKPLESETAPYIPTREDYENLVNEKVRAKYTVEHELAIHRQREDKPDEWQAYYDYCEACKVEAKNELKELGYENNL